jgi:hypothetical protein
MKAKILPNIFISVAVLFALTGLTGGTPQPTFIIFDPPGSTLTQPSAITPSEAIVGSYVDTSSVTHGFLRTPSGSFTTIDVPGSALTTPTDITPSGVITGWYCNAADCLNQAPFAIGGFLRAADGSFTTFSAPVGSYILGSIYNFLGAPPPSINPAGDIAGEYCDAVTCHGFLRTRDGTFTTFDPPDSIFTNVIAINPAGVIVGDFCNPSVCQAYMRTPDGTFTTINANAATAFAINPAGAITGATVDGVGAYLQSPDGTFTVFNPPGSTFTVPVGINPSGAITGWYCDATGCHGFLRSKHGAFTTFDPPGSTFTVPGGVAINPSGVITGAFSDASGMQHGFLRTR